MSKKNQLLFTPEMLRTLRQATYNTEFQDWLEDFEDRARCRQEGRKALIDSVDKKRGVYRLKAYDQKPWYVGETMEHLRIRLNRHNSRSDLLSGRLFEPYEWGEVDIWFRDDKLDVKRLERAIYWSEEGLLNPKVPKEPDFDLVIPPPDRTLKFVDKFDFRDHSLSFLRNTIALGSHIMTTADKPAWHRAFKLRYDYLASYGVI